MKRLKNYFRIKYLGFLFIYFAITASSCHKKTTPVIPVNAALMARFYYQPGTYWIYEDSLTGEVDSFVVTQDYEGQADGYNHSGTLCIFISSGMTIKHYGIHDTEGIDMGLSANEIDFNWLTDYDPLTIYPFEIGQLTAIPNTGGNLTYGPLSDISNIINIFYTYQLSNHFFDTVAEISHITVPNSNVVITHNDTFYMNASVGIIKMILHHPQDTIYNRNRVWELQRYNIIK